MINLKDLLVEVQTRNFETPAATYASNPAPKYRRLISFANQAVQKIIKAHDWSFLKKTATVTIVDGTNQYDKPDDFYRLIPDTTYRGNSFFPIDFPSSDQSIAFRQNYNVSQVYQGRFINGGVEFIDVPAGELTYDYVSRNMVQSSANPSQYGLKFDNDNDIFDVNSEALDELIILGTLGLYLKAKQHSGAADAISDYMYELSQSVSNDTGSRVINDIIRPSERRTLWRHNPNNES